MPGPDPVRSARTGVIAGVEQQTIRIGELILIDPVAEHVDEHRWDRHTAWSGLGLAGLIGGDAGSSKEMSATTTSTIIRVMDIGGLIVRLNEFLEGTELPIEFAEDPQRDIHTDVWRRSLDVDNGRRRPPRTAPRQLPHPCRSGSRRRTPRNPRRRGRPTRPSPLTARAGTRFGAVSQDARATRKHFDIGSSVSSVGRRRVQLRSWLGGARCVRLRRW